MMEFCEQVDVVNLEGVNKRFWFGDLRLSSVNAVYRTRFFTTNLVKGYLYSYTRYKSFLRGAFDKIVVLFVFFSLVLSAMQVGVSLPQLSGSEAFLSASYGFVVFSILVAVVALLLIIEGVVMFSGLNVITARVRLRKVERARQTSMQDEKGGV